MMTPEEVAAVRDASMNLVRIIADLNDVLAAIRGLFRKPWRVSRTT
jgi:hypothetical protein